MRQKSLLVSFWFWLLILGLILILTALLIGGGMKKINGWVWAIFIVGAVFALLGILFAIYEWFRVPQCKTLIDEKISSCNEIKLSEKEIRNSSYPNYANYANEFVDSNYPNYSNEGTNCPSSFGETDVEIFDKTPVKIETRKILKDSPLKSPTKLDLNIPQLQRGFTTSTSEISSLAPSN